jgi:hypothetical protein
MARRYILPRLQKMHIRSTYHYSANIPILTLAIAKQSVGKAKRGEISVNSIRYYLHGIQSFLDFNEIMLNWKKIIKYCPEEVSNNLRGYTREDYKTFVRS